MKLPHDLTRFSRLVWSHYRAHRRSMAWRERPAGMSDGAWQYRIVVSEIMLQQTQVDRVAKKFDSFMRRFPDWTSLADARTADLLREWSGLGYNRRALYLARIAKAVASAAAGGTADRKTAGLPRTYEELRALPGIGPNTAGSILAFAFNIPRPFIETNIRAAYLHFFFPRARRKIPDAELMPLIEASLELPKNRANPREWHYALMDYGAFLKSSKSGVKNPSRRSAHHVRQKPFKGSNRELRSMILRMIMQKPILQADIENYFRPSHEAGQVRRNIAALHKEGFLEVQNSADGPICRIRSEEKSAFCAPSAIPVQ